MTGHPGDVDTLSTNIVRVLGDQELRMQLGYKARQRAERLFTLERMASGVRAVLDELA